MGSTAQRAVVLPKAASIDYNSGTARAVVDVIASPRIAQVCRRFGPKYQGFSKPVIIMLLWFALLSAANSIVAASSQFVLPPGFKPKERTKICFVSVPFAEHISPLLSIAQELVSRGYQVQFASYNKALRQVSDSGINFISLGDYTVSDHHLYKQMVHSSRDPSTLRGVLSMFNEMYLPGASRTFKETYGSFVAEANRPDLLVIDIGTIGAAEAALKLGVPYVLHSPTLLFDMEGRDSFIPAWGSGLTNRNTIWDRCMNVLFSRVLSVALTPPFMNLNKMRRELKLKTYRSQHDVFKGVRILTNSAFGLEYAQDVRPLVEYVGPIAPPKRKIIPLSPSLSAWMKSVGRKKSLIYINLGTMAWLEPWQIDVLIQGLDDPDTLGVIWTMPSLQFEMLSQLPSLITPPESFEILPLVPPSLSSWTIMREKSVKAVLTDCGAGSAELALYFNKPVLCLPFLGDQPDMAARVVDSGAGLSLDRLRLSPQEVFEKVRMITTPNSTYAAQAAKVGALIRRSGGRQRAADAIESVHFVGVSHLQTVDEKLPWFKVAMVDVGILVLAFLGCVLVVSRILTIVFMATVRQMRMQVAQSRTAVKTEEESTNEKSAIPSETSLPESHSTGEDDQE